MSKIDLLDQQWIDLVFDGKNEAYGAYQLRKGTSQRNLMALLILIAGIIAIVAIFLLYGVAKDALTPNVDQEMGVEVQATDVNEEEEDKEEEEDIIYEEPKAEQEQVLLEELVNSEKFTDLERDDEKPVDQPKSNEEADKGEATTGTMDFKEGSDEGTKQMTEEKVIVEEKVEVAPKEDRTVFEVVEQMPKFPGGDAALMSFLSSHIKYPAIAEENGVQGRVVCTFVVEKDGSITDVKVAKGVDPSLDKEAVRVIKSMPKWIPGKQNGSAVRVKFTVPVTFRLQ